MSGRALDLRHLGADLLAARASLSLVGVLLLVQLVLALAGGPGEVPAVYEITGLSREGIAEGRVWQLATHALVHGDWLHVALNALVLLAIGARIERIGGFGLWWRLMLGGTVLGGALHLLAGGPAILVGASGAVMAVLLWLTGVSPGSRMWPVPLSGRSLGAGLLLASLLLMLANPALGLPGISRVGEMLGLEQRRLLFGVSHACHLGGGLAGWLGARWTLRPRITLAKLQRDRRRREGV